MWTTLISGLFGGVGAGVQNYIQHKQDNAKEIELAKIQSENQIKLAELNITQYKAQESIQESKTIETQYNTEARIKEAEISEYEAFTKAVTQQTGIWQSDSTLSNISNFITATLRPFITYIFLITILLLVFYCIKNEKIINEDILIVLETLLTIFDGILSYWFVRRSFEKRYTPQLQKKKLNNSVITNASVQSENSTPVNIAKNQLTAKQIACNIIKKLEGCKLKAYTCSAGVWTIGYGHTVGVKDGMKITQNQADKFLEDDLDIFYNCVIKNVGSICNSNQIASLTSFAFNVGNGNFEKSTLLKVIKTNPQNFPEIEKQFMRWVFAGSKTPLKGLKNRRIAEFNLYKS